MEGHSNPRDPSLMSGLHHSRCQGPLHRPSLGRSNSRCSVPFSPNTGRLRNLRLARCRSLAPHRDLNRSHSSNHGRCISNLVRCPNSDPLPRRTKAVAAGNMAEDTDAESSAHWPCFFSRNPERGKVSFFGVDLAAIERWISGRKRIPNQRARTKQSSPQLPIFHASFVNLGNRGVRPVKGRSIVLELFSPQDLPINTLDFNTLQY